MARKKLQKAFALLLTFSMLMSLLSVTAFADEPEGSGAVEHPHEMILCPDCKGTGSITRDCTACGGDGFVDVACTADGCEGGKVTCTVCGGTGFEADRETPCTAGCKNGKVDCDACHGTGYVEEACTADGCINGKVTTECTRDHGEDGMVPCTGAFELDEDASYPATCRTEGKNVYTCATCGAFYEETLAVDPDAHVWNEGAVTTAATCETAGEMTYTCTVEGCTATKTEPIAALGHEWDEETHKCTRCNAEQPAVAQIGEEKYYSLDEAVENAEDGATIELLADCTTEGLNLSKDLTIQSAEGQRYTVNFTEYGIALWGKALTFRDCDVVMNGIGSTPYTAEWKWMTICANKDASLSLDNVRMTMDGTNAGNAHAIYFCSNNQLNLDHGSVLTIQNYQEDALEWDGGDGGYNVNITDSTYISDHNRSGFTGTFYATIDHSTVKVINSSGNGSNGTYYTIKNQSDVLFDKNGSWGISAYRIDMSNDSTLTATNNEYSGVWTRILNVDGTCTLDVENNGYGGACDLAGTSTGSVSNAGILFWGNGSTPSVIEEGAQVTIRNNAGSGINTRQGVCNLTIYSATITNNGTNPSGVGAVCGGGVYNIGTMILGEDVVIYNNHADTAGDDIYSAPTSDTKTITFGKVGSGWKLDGDPDCTDAIDGWYDDSADARWEAHDLPYHAEEFTGFEILNGMATVEGVLALKAAHSLIPLQPGDPGLVKWEISKSKTATALDANYESQVTLSLPAAGYKGDLDVVFLLDGSTSADKFPLASAAAALLETLAGYKNLNVKAGAVIYGGSEPVLYTSGELLPLSADNVDKLTKEITDKGYDKRTGRSGSNLQAGVEAARALLNSDTTVDAADKYLIILSDGGARMWYNSETDSAMAKCYGGTSLTYFNTNQDFDDRYVNTNAQYSEIRTFEEVRAGNIEDIIRYAVNYKDLATNTTEASGVQDENYYTNLEMSTYFASFSIAQAAVESHVIWVDYPYSSGKYTEYTDSFKSWLEDQGYVTRYDSASMSADDVFSAVEDDLIQLVDAGSEVKDVIGYGQDSQGKDYNFDFVDSLDKLTLTVGGVAQDKTELADSQYSDPYATSAYGFGDNGNGYDYVVTYYKNGQDGQSDECFVWEINKAVTKDAPVQLTYSVKLTNPQTAAGTYGDLDTNTEAILYPVDSKGDSGTPEAFEKPTVDYTVPGGGTGTEDPDDPRPPRDDDDDDDEPAIIPDENTPTTELPDQDTPTTELPEEETPTADIPEEDTPLAEVPETGDVSALWLALTALSGTGLAGVTFLSRKKRDEE